MIYQQFPFFTLYSFKKFLTELQKFKGFLNPQQYKTAIAKLKSEFSGGGNDVSLKLASAANIGSSEARQTILRNRFGSTKSSPNKELEKIEKEVLAETKKQTIEIKKQKSSPAKIFIYGGAA